MALDFHRHDPALLAAGYEKTRSEAGLMIWDVESVRVGGAFTTSPVHLESGASGMSHGGGGGGGGIAGGLAESSNGGSGSVHMRQFSMSQHSTRRGMAIPTDSRGGINPAMQSSSGFGVSALGRYSMVSSASRTFAASSAATSSYLPPPSATSTALPPTPMYQLGPTDSVSSLGWAHSHARIVVAGMSLKSLRVYDLRADPARAGPMVTYATRAVFSIATDPWHECRFASAADDGVVKVWDMRMPRECVASITPPPPSSQGYLGTGIAGAVPSGGNLAMVGGPLGGGGSAASAGMSGLGGGPSSANTGSPASPVGGAAATAGSAAAINHLQFAPTRPGLLGVVYRDFPGVKILELAEKPPALDVGQGDLDTAAAIAGGGGNASGVGAPLSQQQQQQQQQPQHARSTSGSGLPTFGAVPSAEAADRGAGGLGIASGQGASTNMHGGNGGSGTGSGGGGGGGNSGVMAMPNAPIVPSLGVLRTRVTGLSPTATFDFLPGSVCRAVLLSRPLTSSLTATHAQASNGIQHSSGPSVNGPTGSAPVSDGYVLELVTLPDTPQAAWNPNGSLATASGSSVTFAPPGVDDVAMGMRRRAASGYSLNTAVNLTVLDQEERESRLWTDNDARAAGEEAISSLKTLWHWVTRMERLIELGRHVVGGTDCGWVGILQVLQGITIVPSKTSKDAFSTVYLSEYRRAALQFCGWSTREDLEIDLFRLERSGEYEKAALWAFLHGDLSRTIQALLAAKDERLHLVSAALAGYTPDPQHAWVDLCRSLSQELTQPELRAIFTFFSCNDWLTVIYEPLDPREKLLIALRYFSDADLFDFVSSAGEMAVRLGDLSGVVYTGLASSAGVDLLERYVDATGDVQTAALAMAFAPPRRGSHGGPSAAAAAAAAAQRGGMGILAYASGRAGESDPRAAIWTDEYRSFLDRMQLYHVRALFDITAGKLAAAAAATSTAGGGSASGSGGVPDRGIDVAPQVHVRCNFCNQSIAQSVFLPGVKDREGRRVALSAGPSASSRGKPTVCPNCRKSLPRCALCLLSMGSQIDSTRRGGGSGIGGVGSGPPSSALSGVPGEVGGGAGPMHPALGALASPSPAGSPMTPFMMHHPHGQQQAHSGMMGFGASGGPMDGSGARAAGGTVSGFESWFTWCQTCRHGGHAAHVLEWFSKYSRCPVPGCECRCML
ncbi:hypothetical protein BC828DRAFT_378266 [Blastocladiella britannica]|nr:hypothetical protein BC828DRAFT_378266 [Blastocladiella britannica]